MWVLCVHSDGMGEVGGEPFTQSVIFSCPHCIRNTVPQVSPEYSIQFQVKLKSALAFRYKESISYKSVSFD